MRLKDYNKLAYEFAVRHPRAIELLEMRLSKEVVDELLTFGIDATSFDEHTGKTIFSLQELYLEYEHLKHIPHAPYSPYKEGEWIENDDGTYHNNYEGYKILFHPKHNNFDFRESDEEAIKRISLWHGIHGRTLQRLMTGAVFKHYDAVKFFKETVYSLDPSTKTKKTINKDIELVEEWIHPDKYLQLLPKYTSMLDRYMK